LSVIRPWYFKARELGRQVDPLGRSLDAGAALLAAVDEACFVLAARIVGVDG
jgi:hypothetical protein